MSATTPTIGSIGSKRDRCGISGDDCAEMTGKVDAQSFTHKGLEPFPPAGKLCGAVPFLCSLPNSQSDLDSFPRSPLKLAVFAIRSTVKSDNRIALHLSNSG